PYGSAGGCRRRIADNDKLLTLRALGLQPIARPTAAIGCVGSLRDDPFEAELAGMVENRLAVFLEMLAEAQRWVRRMQQNLQRALPLSQRGTPQVHAIKV